MYQTAKATPKSTAEVEGQAKATDYAFWVGDKTLFLVEAKKPAVNIETSPEPAFQVRRYGWSANPKSASSIRAILIVH